MTSDGTARADPSSGSGGLADPALLERVQRQTFGYFWDYAHPASGMARDRGCADGTGSGDLVVLGGSGFGIMAIIVATERGWIGRTEAAGRLLNILDFLHSADSYNGVYPHYIDGVTGKEISFWADNAGGDLVETAYLMTGLLCARQYFQKRNEPENKLRRLINALWQNVNWNWHTKGSPILFWHWSPTHQRGSHQAILGWNECLIAYILAASSPTHPVSPRAYHEGWTTGEKFKNGNDYFGIPLQLGPDFGGPLFFAHFSFLGLDPRHLKDRYADYWKQNCNHTRINYEHCVRNPNGYSGYGPQCWGLSASEGDQGYKAHAPDNDRGVIAPSAALASFPYTPVESSRALRHFYFDLGSRLWGQYGFFDAFNPSTGWYSQAWLAIDQGPTIVMIENYRTGLLWRLFMSCPEVRHGLKVLGFEDIPPPA
jgi:hypothetical protein